MAPVPTNNTLLIVTSDNGMAFPRAKANCYEFGIHLPLAIAWPKQIPAGQRLDDLVSFIDDAATIEEIIASNASQVELVMEELLAEEEAAEEGSLVCK